MILSYLTNNFFIVSMHPDRALSLFAKLQKSIESAVQKAAIIFVCAYAIGLDFK